MHDPVAVEAALQFWSTSLGVDEERLDGEGVTVVPNAAPFPLRGVVILRRRNACVLSVLHPEPSSVIEAVMEIGRRHGPVELLEHEPWKAISSSYVPAATAFIISTNRIPPLPKRGARNLAGSDDLLRVGRLMDRADAGEWEAGAVDPRAEIMAGIFDGDDLAAVASLERASQHLALVRTFVSATHRGKGLGSSLVSHLASQHATTFRALQLTVNKGEKRGEGFALGLGFFPFGETASVVLNH